MRAVTVAENELRRKIRNRSAMIAAFVGPLVMAVVFSLLVQGPSSTTFTIGVVDADRSEASASVVDALVSTEPAEDDEDQEEGRVEFTLVSDEAQARQLVEDDELDSAIVLPAGFGAAATTGGAATITAVRTPERPISGQIAEAVATSLAGRFRTATLRVQVVATLEGAPPDADLVVRAQAVDGAATVVDAPAGKREVDAAAFYGASMSILFLYFTAGLVARSILAQREEGTLARVLSTPTTARQITGGTTAAIGLLGLLGFVTVWVATSLIFGAEWGRPDLVFLLIFATTAAVGGLAVLVASLARTPRQADSYTSAVSFALALLGGNFIGPQAPELLSRLALLTPNGWALRAFTDLSVDDFTTEGLAVTVAVLVGFGMVCGAVGLSRVERVVRP